METQTMARDANPAPSGGVSTQALSHTTLDGARSVFNTFVRTSNKRLCFGMCPACDEPADMFDNIFHEDPSRLRTAAVAVRMRDGKVLGAIVCCAHGQKRTREERLMEPDPGIGESRGMARRAPRGARCRDGHRPDEVVVHRREVARRDVHETHGVGR